MKHFDDVAKVLYLVIMSHGEDGPFMHHLLAIFERLDLLLARSKSRLFLDAEKPQMCDFYGFPHVSRIFYLKGTSLRPVYDLHRFEDRFPHLYGWFKYIREHPGL
jgi:hypothetical protein